VADDPKQLPPPPPLPQRAAIYVAPDGTVHFGALFEGLLPVAAALGGGGRDPHPRGSKVADAADTTGSGPAPRSG